MSICVCFLFLFALAPVCGQKILFDVDVSFGFQVAVHSIPSASFVLICQFAASVAAVLSLSAFGCLDTVEPLSLAKVRPFMGISILFCACLWCNVKALEYANVETVIVFRSMVPIAVALCDFW
jgi:hypothetical protein